MENRDRDKISRNTGSTEAGDVNRSTSSNIGRQKSGSSEFGQNIGRSEGIGSEGIGSESSRQGGSIGSSGMQSGGGRNSGSSGLGSSESSGIGSGDLNKKSGSRGGNSDQGL